MNRRELRRWMDQLAERLELRWLKKTKRQNELAFLFGGVFGAWIGLRVLKSEESGEVQ